MLVTVDMCYNRYLSFYSQKVISCGPSAVLTLSQQYRLIGGATGGTDIQIVNSYIYSYPVKTQATVAIYGGDSDKLFTVVSGSTWGLLEA
ncbi:hypothetical protein Tco_0503431 [Tanacetum coccineum]